MKIIKKLGALSPRTISDMETVLRELFYHTDCFDASRSVIKNINTIVCIDDDVTSAAYAALMYHHLCKKGVNPRVYCVGGRGMLSQHLGKTFTEGKRLAGVCRALGVDVQDIIILDNGSNTGANAQEIIASHHHRDGDVVVCATKRLSLRFERTLKMAINVENKEREKKGNELLDFSPYFYTINETVTGMMKWLNGKVACHGRMLCHEVASILPRCIAYKDKYQLALEKEPTEECMKASRRLERKFGLKGLSLVWKVLSLWQYPFLLLDVKLHIKEMKKEEKKMIDDFNEIIKQGKEEEWLLDHSL